MSMRERQTLGPVSRAQHFSAKTQNGGGKLGWGGTASFMPVLGEATRPSW